MRTSPVDLTVNPAAGQSYTYAGTISDLQIGTRGNATGQGAAINVTISGQGTEVLSGANPYSGTTTISSGTLELANPNAVSGSIVAVNAAGNGLVFASGLGTANLGGLSGSGNIALANLSGGSLTLNVNGTSTTTYSGAKRHWRIDQQRRHADAHRSQQQLHRPDHDRRRGPRPGQHVRLNVRLAALGRISVINAGSLSRFKAARRLANSPRATFPLRPAT